MRSSAPRRIPSQEDIKSLPLELDAIAELGMPTVMGKDLPDDREGFVIGELKRNSETGEWVTSEPVSDSPEGLSPQELLSLLKAMDNLKAASSELVANNIRLAARLCSAAIKGTILKTDREISEAIRKEIQEAVGRIHLIAFRALKHSDLLFQNAIDHLDTINHLIDPNTRTYEVYEIKHGKTKS